MLNTRLCALMLRCSAQAAGPARRAPGTGPAHLLRSRR